MPLNLSTRISNFVHMNGKNLRGARVKAVIKEQGLTLTGVAKKLHIHRVTMSNWLEEDELDYKKIKKIGELLNYDFSKDFPEMKSEAPWLISSNTNERVIELEQQVKFWQDEVYKLSMKCIKLENEIKDRDVKLIIAAEAEAKFERKKGA